MARRAEEVDAIVRRTVQLAERRIPVSAALLFGSYCDGTAGDDSDIDVALFSPAVEKMTLEEKISFLADLRLAVGAEVEIHLFGEDRLREARPTNIYGHVLATGRRIA